MQRGLPTCQRASLPRLQCVAASGAVRKRGLSLVSFNKGPCIPCLGAPAEFSDFGIWQIKRMDRAVHLLTHTDKVQLAEWYAVNRRAVPIRPEPGVLVASIFVSILGSYATLLVLGRRTSPRGFRNLILLLLAAVCFSAVAVWGMHFVSMISIRLRATPVKDGVQWYMQFSAGMTVMSLFIPLIATSFAFWFLASEAEFIWWRGLISGVIVGLTSECLPWLAAPNMPRRVLQHNAAHSANMSQSVSCTTRQRSSSPTSTSVTPP